MSKSTKKRRPPRLSVDPAEHRSQIAILAAAKQRSSAFILTELAGQRLTQLLEEYAFPKDKVAMIPADPEQKPQFLDGSATEQAILAFMQAPAARKTLPDGRRVFVTAQKQAINVRASLVLNTRLHGPVVVGPANLLPDL